MYSAGQFSVRESAQGLEKCALVDTQSGFPGQRGPGPPEIRAPESLLRTGLAALVRAKLGSVPRIGGLGRLGSNLKRAGQIA